MHCRFVILLFAPLLWFGVAGGADPAIAPQIEARVDYNRDIRPILADKCFACHGADSATREAELRLDIRDVAVAMGAIEAGLPEASELVFRIRLKAADDGVMPPVSSHKMLTEAEKRLLEQWIAEGAEYQPHWSFLAAESAEPPEVDRSDWVRNPIDRFVLARMRAEGFQPADEADPRRLARRAALDITGLPPDPALLETFLADERPDAYERYVDRLLESPAWGEHRGRYWLDYARYADTHGIHFDNFREIWIYRDWVIDAFNRNLPFDQFSIEQMAGDMLDQPTMEQRIATGFHRCNMTTNEGGIIDEEYAVLYARDRTETTGAVWLGLTVGCAACHDHKFDPISQKEFYALSAFFNNTTQPVRDGNVPDTPPIIVVPRSEDRSRWSELRELNADLETRVAELESRGRERLQQSPVSSLQVAQSLPHNERLDFHAPLGAGAGPTVTVRFDSRLLPLTASTPLQWADGLVSSFAMLGAQNSVISVDEVGDFDIDQPFTAAAWIYPEAGGLNGAIIARMDASSGLRGWDLWMNGGRIAAHFINHWPESAIKVVSTSELPAATWSHVAIVNDGRGTVAGLKLFLNGLEQPLTVEADSLGTHTIRSKASFSIGGRGNRDFADRIRIQDVRVYRWRLTGKELLKIGEGAVAAYAASQASDQRSPLQEGYLTRWYLNDTDPVYHTVKQELAAAREEREAIRSRATVAHVMQEKDHPATAHILNRGEYDQRLEEVAANVPAALPRMGELPHNRLGLARWLFQDDHPLTARVTVNRFWQEVFGTGLVRTSADFGTTGELPSHPVLLDYLAITFRESGWDVKALFRLMVTSATYRQSAARSGSAEKIDPENRLLSFGPRFRMDAEMIRDTALWASGLLSPKRGGPSVRPYQPPGVWEAVAMPGSDTRNYQQDTGESLYRRSLYTFWKRAAPPASLEIMGAPNREVCTIARERTNTPLQAMVTLNDPQFVEASRAMAERVVRDFDGNDIPIMQAISQRILCRPLEAQEIDIFLASLTRYRRYYQEHEQDALSLLNVGDLPRNESLDAAELAAWTLVAGQFVNLDEALCK